MASLQVSSQESLAGAAGLSRMRFGAGSKPFKIELPCQQPYPSQQHGKGQSMNMTAHHVVVWRERWQHARTKAVGCSTAERSKIRGLPLWRKRHNQHKTIGNEKCR